MEKNITLSAQLKEEYIALWNDPNFRNRFCNRKLKLDSRTEEWVLERDKYVNSNNKNSGCKPEEIPCMELSDKQYQGKPLLIVGINPSGSDRNHYSGNNEDVFVYGGDSLYYREMAELAEKCLCLKDGFSELDLFGIVQSNQSVVKKDFLENPNYYKEMFALFLKYLKLIQPKVVIVANAFVCRILCRDKALKLDQGEFDNFYAPEYSLTANEQFGGYIFSMKDFKTQMYFTSMLSGQRALDNGSKENLIWMIKNYLKYYCGSEKDKR